MKCLIRHLVTHSVTRYLPDTSWQSSIFFRMHPEPSRLVCIRLLISWCLVRHPVDISGSFGSAMPPDALSGILLIFQAALVLQYLLMPYQASCWYFRQLCFCNSLWCLVRYHVNIENVATLYELDCGIWKSNHVVGRDGRATWLLFQWAFESLRWSRLRRVAVVFFHIVYQLPNTNSGESPAGRIGVGLFLPERAML